MARRTLFKEKTVMAGLDPAIHAALLRRRVGARPPKGAEDRTERACPRSCGWRHVDGLVKLDHDGWGWRPSAPAAGVIERRAERATRLAILGPGQIERGYDRGDFRIGGTARVDGHDLLVRSG